MCVMVLWSILVVILIGMICPPLIIIPLIFFGGWLISRVLVLLFADPTGNQADGEER